jgi:hypothetical protein
LSIEPLSVARSFPGRGKQGEGATKFTDNTLFRVALRWLHAAAAASAAIALAGDTAPAATTTRSAAAGIYFASDRAGRLMIYLATAPGKAFNIVKHPGGRNGGGQGPQRSLVRETRSNEIDLARDYGLGKRMKEE